MPVAPFPPPGESVQRQPCGKAAVARSTRGAENVDVPAACAGEPTACDDPRKWDVTVPRLVVKLARVHDVDRPLVVKVTMNEPGDFTFRGSVSVGFRARDDLPLRADQRDLKANVTVRIRIPIPARFKRMIKRAPRRHDAWRLRGRRPRQRLLQEPLPLEPQLHAGAVDAQPRLIWPSMSSADRSASRARTTGWIGSLFGVTRPIVCVTSGSVSSRARIPGGRPLKRQPGVREHAGPTGARKGEQRGDRVRLDPRRWLDPRAP